MQKDPPTTLSAQSHAGMVWAVLLMALGSQQVWMGKCLVPEDYQDPRGGRFSPDVGTQKQEMCVALVPHAHDLAGPITLHSAGSCHTLGWLGRLGPV